MGWYFIYLIMLIISPSFKGHCPIKNGGEMSLEILALFINFCSYNGQQQYRKENDQ